MTECENCRKLEDMYIEDIGKLSHENRLLKAEIEKLKQATAKFEPDKPRQVRHIR